MTKPRINPFSLMFDLIIDLALIGMGALVYYTFEVHPLQPFDLNPIVTNLFGSKHAAILVISIVPFGIGALNLLRTFFRMFKGLMPSKKLEDRS